jgi:predicted RNase H-like nuclease (RuvC/YqgF family)
VSWPREAFEALRQIVLIDERVNNLTHQVKELAHSCKDLDSRLNRLEAKFELLERMATPSHRRELPERSEK